MLEDKIKQFIGTQQGNVSVFVKNLKTNQEIKINENFVFPSASIIKIAIMAELLNRVNIGSLDLEDTVTLEEDMKTASAGILKDLDSGHKFSLKEIMTLMIIISDNTATNILIDLLKIDSINNTITGLGLKDTKLQRIMMDFQAVGEGRQNFITAADAAHLLQLIYEGKCINRKYSDLMLEILKKQQENDLLNLYLPEEITVAHKTGGLDRLQHDVGIVYLPHTEYIICVLTDELHTNKDGREIIGKISKMVYDEFMDGYKVIK